MESLISDWINIVWNEGRLDELPRFHPPVWQDNGRQVSTDECAAWHRQMRATYPDLRYEIDEIVGAGGRWTVRWTARGTQAGTLWGQLPGTGQLLTWRGLHLLHIADGLVDEIWAVADIGAVLQQLNARVSLPK
jgi:predicted ester cyclase